MNTTTAPTIVVSVNGQAHLLPAGSTLAALVAALQRAPDAVATAVDGEFVPRAAREVRVLDAGAQVTFIQTIVGG